MYSQEQRRIAIETFIRFGHSYADTVAEIGYPERHTLWIWWKEYEATGMVPVGKGRHRKSKYSDEQKEMAVGHCVAHGKNLARIARALGFPASRSTLAGWVDELAPGERKRFRSNPKKDCFCQEPSFSIGIESFHLWHCNFSGSARHAAELVDIDLARRRDGQLVAARRVLVARRGRPSQGALGSGRQLPLAGMDKDLR